MEDEGTLILGKKGYEFNVLTDESVKRGVIIFNPQDFVEFIEPVKPLDTKIDLNQLAKDVTVEEKGKVQVNIAQTKEIINKLFAILNRYTDREILNAIKKYRK